MGNLLQDNHRRLFLLKKKNKKTPPLLPLSLCSLPLMFTEEEYQLGHFRFCTITEASKYSSTPEMLFSP